MKVENISLDFSGVQGSETDNHSTLITCEITGSTPVSATKFFDLIAGYSSVELGCLISILRVVRFHYPQPI